MGRYKFVAGVKGRRARIKTRKGIRLRDAGITKQTQSRYYLAVREVSHLIYKCDSFPELDSKVADWIEYKFEHGYPINVVADCLSGIHFFLPLCRRQLPESWKLFGVWRKIEVPSRAPPITTDLLMAMASRALSINRVDFATLLLLGFHCFLRTGELLTITPNDLLLGSKRGVVRLPVSKGKTRRRATESVTIEDPRVIMVAKTLVDIRASQNLLKVPIWQASGSAFRQNFLSICELFWHWSFRIQMLFVATGRSNGLLCWMWAHGENTAPWQMGEHFCCSHIYMRRTSPTTDIKSSTNNNCIDGKTLPLITPEGVRPQLTFVLLGGVVESICECLKFEE